MSIETAGLLSIGRFAQATGLTVKALRHYADIGLLRPAHVDRHTGYRYYAVGQLRAGAAIVRLRALDVPLAEMAPLLDADEATLRERLSVHRKRLAARVDEARQALDAVDRIIDGEEVLVPEKAIGELTVEQMPARSFVVRRRQAPMEELHQVIPEYIQETAGWVFAHGGADGGPTALFDTPDNGVTTVRVGWPVAGRLDPPEPLEFVTCPATRAVVHEHVGPYDALHSTYAALEKAMAAADVHPTGPARESYETNPDEEPDPQKWVTRIVWPVA
jgi:DNA-binding transcriptional MerR regulator